MQLTILLLCEKRVEIDSFYLGAVSNYLFQLRYNDAEDITIRVEVEIKFNEIDFNRVHGHYIHRNTQIIFDVFVTVV